MHRHIAAPSGPVASGSASSSFAESKLQRADCSGRTYAELARRFHEQGYLIFTPCTFQRKRELLDGIEQFTIHAAKNVIQRNRGEGCQGSKDAVNKKTCQFDVVGGERKPIQDGLMNAWKSNQATHDVATCSEVRELLALLHGGAKVAPFQTKNWYLGSMVPTHADLVFHDTWPRRGLLVGTWLALEDVSPLAGPLVYYPGTHNGSLWDFEGLNLTRSASQPHDLNEALKNPYQAYANRIHQVAATRGLRPVQALLKRGEMLVWRGNLLHGGATVMDWNLTRKALTTHYFVSEPGQRHWNPLASAASGRWTKSRIAWIPQPREERTPGAAAAATAGSAAPAFSSSSPMQPVRAGCQLLHGNDPLGGWRCFNEAYSEAKIDHGTTEAEDGHARLMIGRRPS